ncbi:EAL domain-containing protein [Enterobacter hormaechei]|uniref:EAL domain-containing protein n=1 Tax=Enterobacter hormaechei TaxID=158836 RepID=UPI001C689EFA|nr:EAL domain-containing protein [Enterobacter hormaechei]MCM8520153.1 EAL domain-containing protein [Enterobacter hormaechei]QYM50953.1 EAL domain-containing protein [Enterobacter hormaechei]URF01775.1 EAL domain-containing protein [Enterobacter hormaechei]
MSQNSPFIQGTCYKQRFVISACGFTFEGYSLLLKSRGVNATRLHFEEDEVCSGDVHKMMQNQPPEVAVFLGRDVAAFLESLKQLVSVLNALPVICSVTLYGAIPERWLYATLCSLVNNTKSLSMIRIANISDVMDCADNIYDVHTDSSRILRDGPEKEGKESLNGLTKRELTVLLNFYRGISIKEQSARLGLSDKTIYTHRKVGLDKLYLIRVWFSDARVFRDEVCAVKNNPQGFSDAEIDILQALHKREIFAAYQIITDGDKKGVGFEILLRWHKNGQVLKAAQFLGGVKKGEIWLKLTALVIHAAVSGINRYNGKYYFSVNIPPPLATGNALPGMAKKAVEMLLKPQWAGKLVFELAEAIDVTKDPNIPVTLQRLRAEGCRLFLDDCFSRHYAMLPIRQINVDGLKLDRDIVEHFVANDNDYSIIKAIQIYSDMTGRECVAEGVDSEEKFEKLVALGVKRFQGYYLSRAVKEEELDRMVRLFS